MPLISERDRKVIQERFDKDLSNPVTLHYFTQGESATMMPTAPCPTCRETKQILEEVVSISDKVSLVEHDFVADSAVVEEYRIDKIPAIVMEANGRRLRYYGMPSGYEFVVLLEGIVDVSRGSTDLSDRAKQELQTLEKPVHVQVFVTPT